MNAHGEATDSAGNPGAWCDEPRLPALPNRRHSGRIWRKRMFRDATWGRQHKAGFVSGQEEGGPGGNSRPDRHHQRL